MEGKEHRTKFSLCQPQVIAHHMRAEFCHPSRVPFPVGAGKEEELARGIPSTAQGAQDQEPWKSQGRVRTSN